MRKTLPIIALGLLLTISTFVGASNETEFLNGSLAYTQHNQIEQPENIQKVDTEEDIQEDIKISEIQTTILKINNKFEIVEKVIGNKYKNNDILKNQINELNLYVQENNNKLSSDKDLEKQVLTNLKSVETSLNKLLKTFNIKLDKQNKFYEINGIIKNIDGKNIVIESNHKTYKCKLTKQTLIKTDYKEKDKVTIKYSGSTTAGSNIILDDTLYLAVDNNIL